MKTFTFDDVLIEPNFSFIESRKDVNTCVSEATLPNVRVPVISSNMDTVTGVEMAVAMADYGAVGCLHRFMSIQDNVDAVKRVLMNSKNGLPPMVSFGLGSNELERAMALVDAGATHLILDVANGAQINVVKQFNILADKYGSNVGLIVGNFATNKSINTFNDYVKQRPIAYKVGIGGGSACTTRVKTGIGVPTLSSVMDCSQRGNRPVIADGGMKTAGDVAKALGAGAQMVMLGGMLAGTYQTPGEIVTDDHKFMAMSSSHVSKKFKKYRGSASQESYEAQGKSDTHRTAEGESFLVPLKGSVVDVLQDIEGGLRSSMTYTNSLTLSDFRKNCTFIEVSSNTTKENGAHGRSS